MPRWGAKSAATVLAVYKKLEAIPDDPNVWTAKVRGARRAGRQPACGRADAELFRTLATLRFDAPLDESLDDLRWKGPDVPALTQLAVRLGDTQLVEQARNLAK